MCLESDCLVFGREWVYAAGTKTVFCMEDACVSFLTQQKNIYTLC